MKRKVEAVLISVGKHKSTRQRMMETGMEKGEKEKGMRAGNSGVSF